MTLPYGAYSVGDAAPSLGVAFEDSIIDLATCSRRGLVDDDGSLQQPTLNAFLAKGPAAWRALRARLTGLLDAGSAPLIARAEATLHLPFAVGDYVDFYSSRHHAENIGRILRPGSEPLQPNWRHLPVGYHGRAGTVAVSGTPVRRPHGQRPTFGPTEKLDFEAEVGFVVGVAGT